MTVPGATLLAGGRLPALDGATGWLNTEPLTTAGLRGRVVLVGFWTYTCINWLRTAPYVRAWADRYQDQGLVVLGVHTPEFSVERDVDNVRRAVADQGIRHPVALDSDYGIWTAFGNRYWPALYFADATGRIRHRWFGEGDYERSEQVIQRLLAENGADPGGGLVSVTARGAEVAADWDDLQSSETYLGYERGSGSAAPGGMAPNVRRTYRLPHSLRLHDWALAGDWTVQHEAAVLDEAGGRIAHRFHARDLHLVMGPGARGAPVPFRVLLDGQPPGGAAGADVDDDGLGVVTDARLYQLIRQSRPVVDRQFEIEFLEPGVAALAFTFG